MSFRRNGYPILFSGRATLKEVWNDRGTHHTRLVQPYCIIYHGEGGFRLVGLAIELFGSDDHEFIDAQFWGADGLVDPVALFRAVRILSALNEIRPNSLCSAWFAAKGQNGAVTPGNVPSLIQCLGEGSYQAILGEFPRRLDGVLDKLWRYRVRVDTTSLQDLVVTNRIGHSPLLERFGVLPPVLETV